MTEPKTKWEAMARCEALAQQQDALPRRQGRKEWLRLDAERKRLTALAEDLPTGQASKVSRAPRAASRSLGDLHRNLSRWFG